MNATSRTHGFIRGSRFQELAPPILVWTVWGIMTAATVLFVRQYARNIPFMDDFELVPVMTGQQPISLSWLWAQHNEHRPVVSRLILAGLYRLVSADFRVGLYFNAGLLAAAAAFMLMLVRKLRGRTSVTDIALPLAILSLAQAETLLISFALNLILTAWISFELIALATKEASEHVGWPLALRLGLMLVLLPLCGGSGLVMLPPLIVWLAVYCVRGGGLGRQPESAARVVGLALMMTCLTIAGLYVAGYTRPAFHRPPSSFAAAWSTLLEYLSLVVCPSPGDHVRLAGLGVVVLVAVTLVRLVTVWWHQTVERPRALALLSVILSMLCSALAVGWSRSFMGRGGGLAGRYVTTTAPLLCAIYVVWLAYGTTRGRRVVHIVLMATVILMLPRSVKFGVELGETRRSLYLKIEQGLKAHARTSVLLSKACPGLYPEPQIVYDRFKMLRDAGVGAFKQFRDDRVAIGPNGPTSVR